LLGREGDEVRDDVEVARPDGSAGGCRIADVCLQDLDAVRRRALVALAAVE
jgi:hypothetical protein